MQWWLKAVIGIVAWTSVLAVGVIAIGIWAEATLQPTAVEKLGYQVGNLSVTGWLVGSTGIAALCYARKPQ
jgi:hypothetical protein